MVLSIPPDSFHSGHDQVSSREQAQSPDAVTPQLSTDKSSFETVSFRDQSVITNAVLDKMFFANKKSFEGGHLYWVAPYFVEALKTVTSTLAEECQCHFPDAYHSDLLRTGVEVIKECANELSQMQPLAMYVHEYGIGNKAGILKNKEYKKNNDILNTINNTIKEGQTCVIPVVFDHRSNESAADRAFWPPMFLHASLLRISHESEGTCRVVLYNTGTGKEEYHGRGKNENEYQTFLEYKHVPVEDLQDLKVWDDLTRANLTLQEGYDCLSHVCRNGKKQPPPEHEEFYEAGQATGSCAYQCFLAMIRERLVSSVPDPAEGLALYKIVKTKLVEAFVQRTQNSLDPKMTTLSQFKLNILGLDMRLARALVIPSERENVLDELCELLNTHDLRKLAQEIQVKASQDESSLKLFPIVRRAIKVLAKLGELPSISGPGLVREAIAARQEKINRNLLEKLEGYSELDGENRIELAKELLNKLEQGVLSSSVINWLTTNMSSQISENNPTYSLLACFVIVLREVDRKILNAFIKIYADAGNIEMVQFLKNRFSLSVYIADRVIPEVLDRISTPISVCWKKIFGSSETDKKPSKRARKL